MFKKPIFVTAAVGAAFMLASLGAAPIAQAASLTSTQVAAIVNLLQVFGANPATIANVQAVLEGTAVSTSSVQQSGGVGPISGDSQSTNGNGCSVLPSDLQIGSMGPNVSRLQAFLGKDRSIYPEDLVTGYFGSSTLAAVQRWQADHGIVAAGTPQTTGYGSVGPRTRGEMDKEMEMECEGSNFSNLTASSTSSGESNQGDNSSSTTTDGSNSGDN